MQKPVYMTTKELVRKPRKKRKNIIDNDIIFTKDGFVKNERSNHGNEISNT